VEFNAFNGNGTYNVKIPALSGVSWTNAGTYSGMWEFANPSLTFFYGTQKFYVASDMSALGRVSIGDPTSIVAQPKLTIYDGGMLIKQPERLNSNNVNGFNGLTFQDSASFNAWVTGYNTGGGYAIHQYIDSNSWTNRLLISSTGNVGIGTTSPSVLLSLGSSNANQKFALYDGPTGTSNFYGFGAGSSLLQFHAGTTTGSIGQMVLNASGNVGIGTTSPSTKLDVFTPGILLNSSRASSVAEFRGSITTSTPESILRLGRGHNPSVNWGSSAEFRVYNYTTANSLANTGLSIRLGAGGTDNPDTDVMTLWANGNVGIGTTSPSEKLHLGSGNIRLDGYGTIDMGTGNYRSYITHQYMASDYTGLPYGQEGISIAFNFRRTDNSAGNTYNTGGNINEIFVGDQGIRFLTKSNPAGSAMPVERMRIHNSNGYVGIGTTSPVAYLDVSTNNTAANRLTSLNIKTPQAGIVLDSTLSSNGRSWNIWSTVSPDGPGQGSLAFFDVNASAYRMVINTSGNVGLGGTTAPAYQLTLSSDSAAKPSTNTWTVSSDARLKTDIELADLDICYSNVKNIPLKRYTWRDDVYTTEQVPDRSKLGWIAQDVEPYLPKAVDQKDMFGYSDCRTLNSDQIIASLYGAVQKLIERNEHLTAFIESKFPGEL
jgi:hypothetical protein